MSASLGYVGVNSFIGVPFGVVQSDGAYATEPPSISMHEATVIPYSGGVTDLQLSGSYRGEMKLQIEVDLTNWLTFKGKRHQTGTLALFGSSYAATLLSWDMPKRSDKHGFVLVEATFYVA